MVFAAPAILEAAFLTVLGTGASTLMNDIRQQFRKKNCHGVKLKIKVPIREIERLKQYEMIKVEGWVGSMCATFHVACGHWDKLHLTPEEKRSGFFNLMDHLPELVSDKDKSISPLKKGTIGLVTFQNGINNTPEDFKNKGKWILQNLPEKPLCIGMYNPSHGKLMFSPLSAIPDLLRLFEEWISNTDTLCCTWRAFTTIAEQLPPDRKLYWLHIAHSEGGLIAKLAITEPMNTPSQNDVFQNRLLTLTYGSVMPISKQVAALAINIYSKTDIALEKFGKEFANDQDYDIVKLDQLSTLTMTQKRMEGDHDFLGTTYMKVLRDNLRDLRRDFQVYAK